MEIEKGERPVLLAAKVDPKLREALRALAASNHRSLSGELRLAVIRHLEREAA
jgi:hypothetical protein